MRCWRLVIPWDPNTLSENRSGGRHIGTKAHLAKEARIAGQAAWAQAGWPRARTKVKVSMIVRRRRRMDVGNIIGGMKHALDGIFVGGLTPDDGPDWVEVGSIEQETGKQFHPAEVELLVEEIERLATMEAARETVREIGAVPEDAPALRELLAQRVYAASQAKERLAALEALYQAAVATDCYPISLRDFTRLREAVRAVKETG